MKPNTAIMLFVMTAFPIVGLANTNDAASDGNTDEQILTQEEVFNKIKLLRPDLADRHIHIISKHMRDSIVRHKLPVNVVLSIGYLESGFNQGAIGTQDEIGIMQVMPFWKKRDLCKGLQLWNIQGNVECGCRILRGYMNEFKDDELYGVLAYNAGYDTAKRLHIKKINLRRSWYMKTVLDIKKVVDNYDKKHIADNK